jgi:hypothetical protein
MSAHELMLLQVGQVLHQVAHPYLSDAPLSN